MLIGSPGDGSPMVRKITNNGLGRVGITSKLKSAMVVYITPSLELCDYKLGRAIDRHAP